MHFHGQIGDSNMDSAKPLRVRDFPLSAVVRRNFQKRERD